MALILGVGGRRVKSSDSEGASGLRMCGACAGLVSLSSRAR